jgi:hypothetical protein
MLCLDFASPGPERRISRVEIRFGLRHSVRRRREIQANLTALMSEEGGRNDDKPPPRGAALRRALARRLPVPDLAADKRGALVVDAASVDVGADELAEPLQRWIETSPRGQAS